MFSGPGDVKDLQKKRPELILRYSLEKKRVYRFNFDGGARNIWSAGRESTAAQQDSTYHCRNLNAQSSFRDVI